MFKYYLYDINQLKFIKFYNKPKSMGTSGSQLNPMKSTNR